jgi:hypothetical protein
MNQPIIRFDVNDIKLRNDFFNSVLPEAITRLEDTMNPMWGQMTAQQMIEHLLWAFEIATGKVPVVCAYPEAVSERFKTFLYNNQPTPIEFKNPLLNNGLPALRFQNLDEAKEYLNGEINFFLEYSHNKPDAKYIHPVFGLLNMDNWHRSSYKHSFHHLIQFSLISQRG